MENQCPVCRKVYSTLLKLRRHTGVSDPSTCTAHPCTVCRQMFCSAKAQEQHVSSKHGPGSGDGGAPTQAGTAQKDDGADQEEKRSALPPLDTSNNDALLSSRFQSVQFVKASEADKGTAKKNGKKNKKAKSKGSSNGGYGYGYSPGSTYTSGSGHGLGYGYGLGSGYASVHNLPGDDEDWTLCDKDCGWCGRCADGVDF